MKKIISIFLLLCVLFTACDSDNTDPIDTSSPENPISNTTVPSESSTVPETTASPEVSEYLIVDTFIELFNSTSSTPVTNSIVMDIHGDDYRTEFRLPAFENSVGIKGDFEEGTIEVINYGTWKNDSIRIYARTKTHDAAIAIVYDVVHILDGSISDDEIAEDVETEHSILLGSQINGFISTDYADGGVAGYDVMIDCGNLDFVN